MISTLTVNGIAMNVADEGPNNDLVSPNRWASSAWG